MDGWRAAHLVRELSSRDSPFLQTGKKNTSLIYSRRKHPASRTKGPICECHLRRWPAGGAVVRRLRLGSQRAKRRYRPFRHLPVRPHSAAALRLCGVGKGQPSFQTGTVTRRQTLGDEGKKLHLGGNGTGVARGSDASTCGTVYIALTWKIRSTPGMCLGDISVEMLGNLQ